MKVLQVIENSDAAGLTHATKNLALYHYPTAARYVCVLSD
jgi:hypothetical protein